MTSKSNQVVTHIVYLSPGLFGSSVARSERVETRDPQLHARKTWGNVFAFYYIDLVEFDAGVEGRESRTYTKGDNTSKTYYINATLHDRADVGDLANPSWESVWFKLDERLGDSQEIVLSRYSNWIEPFNPDNDEIVHTST